MIDKVCKCGCNMLDIARETDYGDTTAYVRWCLHCGRVCITYTDLHGRDPDEDQWNEPLSVTEVNGEKHLLPWIGKKVRCLGTGAVFKSIEAVADMYSLRVHDLVHALRTNEECGGCHWELVEVKDG